MAMNLAQLAIEEEYVGDLARAEGREAYARVAWKAKQPATYKECPGCSVMTEKTEGCNHIECDCGSHWCWECRFMPEGKVQGEEAAQQVYRHMSRVHGGYYGGDED